MNNLAEFDDYRVFLRTLAQKRKSAEVNYSQSAFAREMGIRPNRLSEIFQKKQGLSGKAAADIAKRLKLTQQQSKYFYTLVLKEHARSIEERNHFKKQAELLSGKMLYHDIQNDLFSFISDWYHLAIIELSKISDFEPNADWISQKLGISKDQAKSAISRMHRLKLIEWNSSGWSVKKKNTVTSGNVPSKAIRSFHEQLLHLAIKAQNTQSIFEKEYRSLIVAVSPEQVPYVKKRLSEFVFKLDQELARERNPKSLSSIYCLSAQFFRLGQEDKII